MSSSINPIKALANRFVSLPPLVRMNVTRTLLEIYTSGASGKSFLEQFWDEVEKAHGYSGDAVNPFTETGRKTINEMKRGARNIKVLSSRFA